MKWLIVLYLSIFRKSLSQELSSTRRRRGSEKSTGSHRSGGDRESTGSHRSGGERETALGQEEENNGRVEMTEAAMAKPQVEDLIEW